MRIAMQLIGRGRRAATPVRGAATPVRCAAALFGVTGGGVTGGGALVTLVTLVTLLGASGCGRSSSSATAEGDRLPGRTRSLLQHDWAHPRDLRFDANRFTPPDPTSAYVVTASGVRAFVIAADDEQIVQVTAGVPLGRAVERSGEAGGAELLSRLLAERIQRRVGPAFTGRVQVDQDADLTRVSLQTLRDEWRGTLTGLVGALREFEVDARDAAGYRTGPGYTRRARGIAGAGFRPAIELARLVAPYPVAPPDAGLTLPLPALRALASRALAPQAVVLGIGGGIPHEEAARELEALTSGWQADTSASDSPGRSPASSVRQAPEAAGPSSPAARVRTIDEPGFTTWIALGHALPPLAPADESAVAVMTEILNIRLNIAVREIRGLANQAVLHVPATTRHGGLLHVRTGGRPESVAPLLHYAREELTRIRDARGQPTNDEIEQAKGGLVLGKWQGSLDGARAASATYAIETARYGSLDRLRQWPESVRAVTAEQVRQAATTYIQPDKLGTIVIGQVDAARQARHPRWPFALEDELR